MNEKFFNLPIEKQDRIINSAYKIFSQNTYKKSPTSEIAAEAGISKSLLFHYFKNKKELYIFLYNYSIKFVNDNLNVYEYMKNEKDLFKYIGDMTIKKGKLLKRYPYMMEFMIKTYYEDCEELSDFIYERNQKESQAQIDIILENFDLNLFKHPEDAPMILNMLIWLSDGYMNFKYKNPSFSLNAIEEIETEYGQILDLLKKYYYKEGYKK